MTNLETFNPNCTHLRVLHILCSHFRAFAFSNFITALCWTLYTLANNLAVHHSNNPTSLKPTKTHISPSIQMDRQVTTLRMHAIIAFWQLPKSNANKSELTKTILCRWSLKHSANSFLSRLNSEYCLLLSNAQWYRSIQRQAQFFLIFLT